MKKSILSFLMLCSITLFADQLNIFGATATKYAMEELRTEFLKKRQGDEIKFYAGSSGKAYTQFNSGMRYDMFFSADSKYPEQIVADGNAITPSTVYAIGVLAFYSLDQKLIDEGIKTAATDKIKKISIANPKVAPYGTAAMEVLKNASLLEAVRHKIVLGENLSQAIHFVDSGAADMGLIAFSLLKETNAPKGVYKLVDQSLYAPLYQSFVLTKYAKNKPLAQEFAHFVLSEKGQVILEKYGFRRAQ
ncbi:MAG TPA: molybdate ABC transporter substrate-binding protein [Sulfurovum sp. UBA12169]|nr:MAG TPA: molybdate ABC transporter substrate-binding protein [Sulfurovum sp. UBA12169]